jgi:hypothetical protein
MVTLGRLRRETAYAALLIAEVAPLLAALLLHDVHRLGPLLLLLAPVLAALLAPVAWPGGSRLAAAFSMVPGLVVQVVAGVALLFVLGVRYCAEYAGHVYLSAQAQHLVVLVAPGVAFAIAAIGCRRLERVQWVWPAAILAGYAISGVTFAIAVGGAHSCST